MVRKALNDLSSTDGAHQHLVCRVLREQARTWQVGEQRQVDRPRKAQMQLLDLPQSRQRGHECRTHLAVRATDAVHLESLDPLRKLWGVTAGFRRPLEIRLAQTHLPEQQRLGDFAPLSREVAEREEEGVPVRNGVAIGRGWSRISRRISVGRQGVGMAGSSASRGGSSGEKASSVE